MRAEITPGSVARSSSARCIGRTLPAIKDDSAECAVFEVGSDNACSGVEAILFRGYDDAV